MSRCRACGAPIHYAPEDRHRRFPLNPDEQGHVCWRWPGELIPQDMCLPDIRAKECRKEKA